MRIERRNGKRYGSRFGVVFHDHGNLSFSFITNLSRSGAYLTTRHHFELGSHVSMRLSNGNYEAPIDGTVVRLERSQEDPTQFGLGINFSNLSPSAKRLRDDLLLFLMNLKYHKQWNQQL